MTCPNPLSYLKNNPGVTRIPIAGKAPYNTLVCVNYFGPVPSDIHLTRARVTLTSTFQLSKFDQVNPPPEFAHTTMGWVGGTAALNEGDSLVGPDAWLYAVDDVYDAGFDADGFFYVVVDTSTLIAPIPLKFIAAGAGILIACSYILVVEPQPATGGGKHPPRRPFTETDSGISLPQ